VVEKEPTFVEGEGLQWILGEGISKLNFLADYWEKKPLHVSRGVEGT